MFYECKRSICKECVKKRERDKYKAAKEMFGRGDKETIKENAPFGEPCSLCERPMVNPNFDHDPVSGKFRGWICSDCNTGLGKLGDNIEGLQKAIDYLSTTV